MKAKGNAVIEKPNEPLKDLVINCELFVFGQVLSWGFDSPNGGRKKACSARGSSQEKELLGRVCQGRFWLCSWGDRKLREWGETRREAARCRRGHSCEQVGLVPARCL